MSSARRADLSLVEPAARHTEEDGGRPGFVIVWRPLNMGEMTVKNRTATGQEVVAGVIER